MLIFISATAHKAVEMLGLTTPNCFKSAVYGHNMGGVSLSVPHAHTPHGEQAFVFLN